MKDLKFITLEGERIDIHESEMTGVDASSLDLLVGAYYDKEPSQPIPPTDPYYENPTI